MGGFFTRGGALRELPKSGGGVSKPFGEGPPHFLEFYPRGRKNLGVSPLGGEPLMGGTEAQLIPHRHDSAVWRLLGHTLL